jgi:hypothetical protein
MMGRPSVMLMPWPKVAYLSTGKALVVIHREHRVGIVEQARHEQRVGRQRAVESHAFGAQRIEHRRDDVDFLAPHVPAFAGVRVEPRHQDARLRDAELAGADASCRMRSVRVSDVCVMAAGTADSGRCVVASATRSSVRVAAPTRPASIITTRAVAVVSARYSVCPENGMPASLMTPLCTGAVTIAANSPDTQPSRARDRAAPAHRRIGCIEPPGDAGRSQGHMQHLDHGVPCSPLPSAAGS